MDNPMRPIVVFEGRSELDAQIARDVLVTAMVPVVHVPSLSTGIFGVPQTTRVAVPERFAEQAVQVLKDAGLEGEATELPKGVAAFQQTVQDRLPVRPFLLPGRSRLARVLVGLAIVIVIHVLLNFFLTPDPPAEPVPSL